MPEAIDKNAEASNSGAFPPVILQPDEDDWLASLLPVVLGLSVSSSNIYGFVGSSFVSTPEGGLITADHVAKELDDAWQHRRYSNAQEQARPGALYLPVSEPYLIPVLRFLSIPDSAGSLTDLAFGQLALPAGPGESLLQMQSLGFSDEPVAVGEEVTMVGYLHDEESVEEGAKVFRSGGALAAIPATVTRVHESVPLIPAPVFEMDSKMPGGMSGGPIFRAGTNEVVGVCSMGLVSSDVEPYCYGSAIQPLVPWLRL